jgi:hypothetical protein
MRFRINGIVKGEDLGTRVVSVKGPDHGLELTLRQSNPDEQHFQAGDASCESSSEREIPEALLKQVSAVRPLSIDDDLVGEVLDELHDFVGAVLRVIRWRRGQLASSPKPLFYRRTFEWSLDGTKWEKVDTGELTLAADFGVPYQQWSDEVERSVADLVLAGTPEPIAHELLCEAELNVVRNPRSAVVMAVAAAEIGLKQLIGTLAPDAKWLIENLEAPSVDKLLSKYLPQLRPTARIGSEEPFVPTKLRKRIAKAVESRNKTVHAGQDGLDSTKARDVVTAVHDLLCFLDLYAGHQWALGNVTVPTIDELRVELGERAKKSESSS